MPAATLEQPDLQPRSAVGPDVDRFAHKIAQWRKCAHRVLANLAEVNEQDIPEHAKGMETVRRLAQDLIATADSPVRIGLVGGFNAGKSLLLGTLLGNAELLPVLDRPTTGNITALQIRAEAGIDRTTVVETEVEWVDRKAVEGCLRALLEAAAERSKGLTDIDQQTLSTLLQAAAEENFQDWERLEAWCRHSWDRSGEPPNPLFRYVLRELVWFGRCCSSAAGRQLLGQTKKTSKVPDGVDVQRGLELPPQQNMAKAKFKDLPPGPGTLPFPDTLTTDFLQKAFPLVRRVRLNVQVPAGLWNLSVPGGIPFLLLDFPGLGAAQSGVRDEYLCRQELEDVQTILIVLNAQQVGGTVGPELFNRLQSSRPRDKKGQNLRDNILVAINRFDQIKCPLRDANKIETLTEEKLPADLPALHSAWSDAAQLTLQPTRTCLTSAMAAVERLSARYAGVCSDAFFQNLRGELRRWEETDRDAWRKVADRLAALPGEKGPVLADQLHALIVDGGLARLREVLIEHVAEHGLSQLLDRVQQLGRQLRREYESLPLGRERRKEGPSYAELVERLQQLRTAYSTIQLEQTEKPLCLEIDRKGLFTKAEELVREAVWKWDEWGELLGKLNQGRLPAQLASTKASDDVWGDDWDMGEQTGPFPENSLYFYSRYEATLRTCWEQLCQIMSEAITEYLQSLKHRIEEETPELGDLLQRAQQQRGTSLDKPAQQMLTLLLRAVDPATDKVRELFDSLLKSLKDAPIDPTACYPLRGKNGDTSPQQLAWSTLAKDPENRIDHVLIMRLRNQFVLGARDPILQQVQLFNQKVAARLKELYSRFMNAIEKALENRALLRAVVGPGGEKKEWKLEEVRWPSSE
jgi:hypothetical protein